MNHIISSISNLISYELKTFLIEFFHDKKNDNKVLGFLNNEIADQISNELKISCSFSDSIIKITRGIQINLDQFLNEKYESDKKFCYFN